MTVPSGLPSAFIEEATKRYNLWCRVMTSMRMRRRNRINRIFIPLTGHSLPWIDHPEQWSRQGGQHIFIAQPYIDTRGAHTAHLRSWCFARNLRWRIEPEWSWHYPTKTTLIVVAPWKLLAEFEETREFLR